MIRIDEIRDRFRITADYHTHTVYSKVGPYLHAKGKVIDNVASAVSKGLRRVAITDHGPTDLYGIKLADIPRIRADIDEAKSIYPDIEILLGVEADITDSPNGLDVKPEDMGLFDFINAGYHFVPNCKAIKNFLIFHLVSLTPKFPMKLVETTRQENTARIAKALRSNRVLVLTHPGDKALIDTEAVAKVCEETGTLVEINARHMHPNASDLRKFAKYDVKFVIGSDAHSPSKVGRYIKSLELALKAGIDPSRIVNIEPISK